MFTVDGLASGLNTTAIIEQILQLERRPISLISRQISTANQRQTAFLDLSARLLNLQLSSKQRLRKLWIRSSRDRRSTLPRMRMS